MQRGCQSKECKEDVNLRSAKREGRRNYRQSGSVQSTVKAKRHKGRRSKRQEDIKDTVNKKKAQLKSKGKTAKRMGTRHNDRSEQAAASGSKRMKGYLCKRH